LAAVRFWGSNTARGPWRARPVAVARQVSGRVAVNLPL
jgi:hypothetical protein